MAQPTIARRLQRKFIVMSRDAALIDALRAQVPPGWEMVVTTELDTLGDWNELLLYRFLLLDLDEHEAFDPLAVVQALRNEHMVQLAVLCFGGDRQGRDALRRARADRFYERGEMVAVLPVFLQQYGWGG